jgi:hypothetical protein
MSKMDATAGGGIHKHGEYWKCSDISIRNLNLIELLGIARKIGGATDGIGSDWKPVTKTAHNRYKGNHRLIEDF